MESVRTTARDIRRGNRATVLTKLFFDGPLSRLELSQATGLSTATVSNVTGELVDEQLIVEAGQVESDGGRPRVLLRVDPGYASIIGIDVGETGVKVELFDLAMQRKAAVDQPLPTARPEPAAVAAQVTSGIREVLLQSGVSEEQVLGVGVGVPGTVERAASAVVHAPTIGWSAVPLEELLRKRGVAMPLFVENGAKTQGQAEMWFGAGRRARHAVIVLVGSGVGASIITDGGTYRGVSSSAGEWGHTTIVYGGRPCRCGSRGCLEAYTSNLATLSRYLGQTLSPDALRPMLHSTGLTITDVIARARSGDQRARAVLEETARYLGVGLAVVVNTLNPSQIFVGGEITEAWEQIAPTIRATVRSRALTETAGSTPIIPEPANSMPRLRGGTALVAAPLFAAPEVA